MEPYRLTADGMHWCGPGPDSVPLFLVQATMHLFAYTETSTIGSSKRSSSRRSRASRQKSRSSPRPPPRAIHNNTGVISNPPVLSSIQQLQLEKLEKQFQVLPSQTQKNLRGPVASSIWPSVHSPTASKTATSTTTATTSTTNKALSSSDNKYHDVLDELDIPPPPPPPEYKVEAQTKSISPTSTTTLSNSPIYHPLGLHPSSLPQLLSLLHSPYLPSTTDSHPTSTTTASKTSENELSATSNMYSRNNIPNGNNSILFLQDSNWLFEDESSTKNGDIGNIQISSTTSSNTVTNQVDFAVAEDILDIPEIGLSPPTTTPVNTNKKNVGHSNSHTNDKHNNKSSNKPFKWRPF